MEDAFDGQHPVEGVVLERQLTGVGLDPVDAVAGGGDGLCLGGGELARVDVQAGEVHAGMRGVDLLDGSAESTADVQQALPVGHLAGLEQYDVHLFHGGDVVGPAALRGPRVFPIPPVHLLFPQLAGFTPARTLVHQ